MGGKNVYSYITKLSIWKLVNNSFCWIYILFFLSLCALVAVDFEWIFRCKDDQMSLCIYERKREKRTNNLNSFRMFNTPWPVVRLQYTRVTSKESKALFVKRFVVGFYISIGLLIYFYRLFKQKFHDGSGDNQIYPTYERVQLDCVYT